MKKKPLTDPINLQPPKDCEHTGKMQVSKAKFGKGERQVERVIAVSVLWRQLWPSRSKYVPHLGKHQAGSVAKREQLASIREART
jgi:hypothetical protein